MAKKDFTKATMNVADKFFSKPDEIDKEEKSSVVIPLHMQDDNDSNNIKHSHNYNITHDEHNTKDTKHTHITNKSKHYNDRGKREERYGLLMDKQLKEDLKHLSNATGSRSINDFIVTILLEYVEAPEHQEILQAYKKLLTLKK